MPRTALALSLVPFALVLWLMPATGDQDAAIHAVYARHPTNPARVLSVWSRPLFAVPYMLPARWGYGAMRVTTAIICAAAAWLTYLAARRIGLPRPWLAIPLTLLQPVLFQVGTDALTEPIFALTLAGGLYALACDRVRLGAVVLSFLPLARPEGPLVLVVVAALWIRDRRWKVLPLLGVGTAVWILACLVATGDPLYLQRTFPWVMSDPRRGPIWHYVVRWPLIVGIGLLPLWLAGLRSSLPLVRLGVLATGFVVIVHGLLFATGGFGSTGFDRYFATLAPFAALAGVAGVEALGARLRTWALAALLAVQAVQAWVWVDAPPVNHQPAATLEAVRRVPDRPILFADIFGYVFLGRDRLEIPIGDREAALAMIRTQPPGTCAVWDNLTGEWWYKLTIDDFVESGWTVTWERRDMLATPRAPLYSWVKRPERLFRQALLVKQ
jgi:hypothetical protein